MIVLLYSGAGLLAAAGSVYASRWWHARWGTRGAEATAPMPGDELLSDAQLVATHALDIDAPPAQVWAWVVQIGADRGGFYSYSWIENLVGCGLENADRIVPEWQTLAAGHSIRFHPRVPPVLVAHCAAPHTLVLFQCRERRSGASIAPNTPRPAQYDAFVWSFALRPTESGGTRLIQRFRIGWSRSLLRWIFFFLFVDPGHFVMEHGMMRGIKARAEGRCTASVTGG